MIKGYVANGRYSDAPEFVFRCALDDPVDMIAMDSSVLVSILTVSAHLGLHRVGKQVHGHIVALGTGEYGCLCTGDNAVLWSALIDMYCKCSSVMEARSVLDGFT